MPGNNLSRKRSLPSTSNYHHERGFHVAPRETCILCDQQHSLLVCPSYANKSVEERLAIIRARNLSFNCLGSHHSQECTSSQRYKICECTHHSSLHTPPALKSNNNSQRQTRIPKSNRTRGGQFTGANVHTARISAQAKVMLLATARVEIVSKHGMGTQVRALLDQGSEVSFISESVVQLLSLPKRRVAQIPSANRVEIPLVDVTLPILADPHFNSPDSIDLILYADIYKLLLRQGIQRVPGTQLVAQNTVLCWIVSGSIPPIWQGGRRLIQRHH
jgi:hypothetical protein